jgi:hypothetical protein
VLPVLLQGRRGPSHATAPLLPAAPPPTRTPHLTQAYLVGAAVKHRGVVCGDVEGMAKEQRGRRSVRESGTLIVHSASCASVHLHPMGRRVAVPRVGGSRSCNARYPMQRSPASSHCWFLQQQCPGNDTAANRTRLEWGESGGDCLPAKCLQSGRGRWAERQMRSALERGMRTVRARRLLSPPP